MPFILLHVAAVVAPFFVPITWTAVGLGVLFYVVRMFGITGVYHRYFAHRAYKTSRWFQFVLAWIGCSAMQKGPLWWAGHHRHHHKHSDHGRRPALADRDAPSGGRTSAGSSPGRFRDAPRDEGLREVPANCGCSTTFFTWVPGLTLAALCYLIDGWSGVVWGFLVSTVLLYHGDVPGELACHLFGTRRYDTTDQSKNCWWAAILTLGEGWHNNHHHYQSCARQGFMWWEIDMSYYIIRALALVGLVWDVREPTEKALNSKTLEPEIAIAV